MKKILTVAALLAVCFSLSAQQGTARNDCVLESKILGQTTHYSIYLPAGYETSNIDYPVLYLLHGGGDNWKDWLLKGQAASIADRTIASGEAPAMIIVMPDGMQNWYANKYDGSFNYEDYFFKELIPHIEKTYRCRTERSYRAISGLSMGGYGCLLYALKHPDMFCACYGMSIGMFGKWRLEGSFKMEGGDWYASKYFGPMTKDGKLPQAWYDNDVYTLIENMSDQQKRMVNFCIECGDDELNRDQAEVFLLMKDKNVPCEIRIADGAHNWIFWRQCLPHAMKWAGECFIQERMVPMVVTQRR